MAAAATTFSSQPLVSVTDSRITYYQSELVRRESEIAAIRAKQASYEAELSNINQGIVLPNYTDSAGVGRARYLRKQIINERDKIKNLYGAISRLQDKIRERERKVGGYREYTVTKYEEDLRAEKQAVYNPSTGTYTRVDYRAPAADSSSTKTLIYTNDNKPVSDLLSASSEERLLSKEEGFTQSELASELKRSARERNEVVTFYDTPAGVVAASPAYAQKIEANQEAVALGTKAISDRRAVKRDTNEFYKPSTSFTNPVSEFSSGLVDAKSLTSSIVGRASRVSSLSKLPANLSVSEFTFNLSPTFAARAEKGNLRDVPFPKQDAVIETRSTGRKRSLKARYEEARVAGAREPVAVVSSFGEYSLDRAQEKSVNPGVGVAKSAGFFAAGALLTSVGGAADIVSRPVATVKGVGGVTKELVTKPKLTAAKFESSLVTSVPRNPLGVVADYVLFDKGIKAVVRTTRGVGYLGKDYRLTTDVVDPQVLLGVTDDFSRTTRYPQTLATSQEVGSKQLVKNINEQGYVFSATRPKLSTKSPEVTSLSAAEKEAIGLPPSETGGIFASDKTSSAFLRLDKAPRSFDYEVSFTGANKQPSIEQISTKAGRIPSAERTSFAKANEYLETGRAAKQQPNKALISPAREFGKTEAEVIITPGTILQRTEGYGKVATKLGWDFDEFTLVPNIPENNLAKSIKVIDPDTGKLVNVKGKFVGMPTPRYLKPVPIRKYEVVDVKAVTASATSVNQGVGSSSRAGLTSTKSGAALGSSIAKAVLGGGSSKTSSKGTKSMLSSGRAPSNSKISFPYSSRAIKSGGRTSTSSRSEFISTKSLFSSIKNPLSSTASGSSKTSSSSRSSSSSTISKGGSSGALSTPSTSSISSALSSFSSNSASSTTVSKLPKIPSIKPPMIKDPFNTDTTKKRRNRASKKQKKQYKPSLAGITLGIKESNKKKEGFTGLEIRGI